VEIPRHPPSATNRRQSLDSDCLDRAPAERYGIEMIARIAECERSPPEMVAPCAAIPDVGESKDFSLAPSFPSARDSLGYH
jgi:hypothetical protein